MLQDTGTRQHRHINEQQYRPAYLIRSLHLRAKQEDRQLKRETLNHRLLVYACFWHLVTQAQKVLYQYLQVKDAAFKKLQHGADVVVTDEAHELRNAKSGMAIAMSKFKTKKRIALTGYPLQNKLGEYWTMINWIGQTDVVGNAADFHEQYGLPIEKGKIFP